MISDSMAAIISKNFDLQTADNIKSWLQGDFPDKIKKEIGDLLETDPKSLVDSFYKNLSFGTGGLRGIVGVGTNRINVFNIRKATLALVKYLEGCPFPSNRQRHKVIIGYDTRTDSRIFASETAAVFSSFDIEVLLFEKPRPVGMVSFGVIHEQCSLGVMITASHNPHKYNGYKVYMHTGGQVVAPFDAKIIKEFNGIRLFSDAPRSNDELIRYLGEDMDRAYIAALSALQLHPEDNRNFGGSLRMVYSSLHGTGIEMVPRVLKSWGFSEIEVVQEQASQDGLFPTVRSPNPEEKETLVLGVEQLKRSQADLFLATDPDSDRVGVVILDGGQEITLNGNQIACLLAHHILGSLSSKVKFDLRYKVVTTIVTTELLKKIAGKYGLDVVDVPTGFKYIGEKMTLWQGTEISYIFGAEESYGYLYGTYAKDKDAVSSAALIAEAALQAKRQSKTLLHILYDIYNEHGFYVGKTISKEFQGKSGDEEMKNLMKRLREFGRSQHIIGNRKILLFEDYSSGKFDYTLDVIRFFTDDGCRIICRPSGTEPKIKFYFELSQQWDTSVSDPALNHERLSQVESALDAFINSVHSIWKWD